MAFSEADTQGDGQGPNVGVTAELIDLEASIVGMDQMRVQALAEGVLSAEGQRGDWSVSVVLVDDARLRELHRSFMGVDEETDVMTFPSDPGDERAGGEIVISIDRATEQGPPNGHSPLVEVEFPIIHGLLHLCGWNDATPGDRERMLARQAELLQRLDRRRVEGIDCA